MKKRILLTVLMVCASIFALGSISASAETEGIYTYSVSNGEATVIYCDTSGAVAIPSTLGGYSVTSIGEAAFSYSGLTSITIPNSVTSIEDEAFLGCGSLTNITIPSSVTSIGNEVFTSCERLTNITVDSNNDYYSSLDGNLYDKNKTTLIQYAPGKQDAQFAIPNGVTIIGNEAFSGCGSLTNITIPNSVNSIGYYAFYFCNGLTNITIPNSITSIENGTFRYCESLTNITIPNSVVSIGEAAFSYSGLTNIIIPNSVTSIGDYAFLGCVSLTSITIPNSVTSIKENAFSYCNNLKNVYYDGSEEQWRSITIKNGNGYLINATIYYNSKELKPISVYLNNKQVEFDVPPIIENGRTLVPVRAIFEAMGMTVSWDGETSTITANGNGNYISMHVNETTATANGKTLTMDVPSKIVNGRTLVPVRFIAESLGAKVDWDGENSIVYIND